MTERRRVKGDPRLGFRSDELEGEECVDCGEPAVLAVDDADGLTHYCAAHAPLAGDFTLPADESVVSTDAES